MSKKRAAELTAVDTAPAEENPIVGAFRAFLTRKNMHEAFTVLKDLYVPTSVFCERRPTHNRVFPFDYAPLRSDQLAITDFIPRLCALDVPDLTPAVDLAIVAKAAGVTIYFDDLLELVVRRRSPLSVLSYFTELEGAEPPLKVTHAGVKKAYSLVLAIHTDLNYILTFRYNFLSVDYPDDDSAEMAIAVVGEIITSNDSDAVGLTSRPHILFGKTIVNLMENIHLNSKNLPSVYWYWGNALAELDRYYRGHYDKRRRVAITLDSISVMVHAFLLKWASPQDLTEIFSFNAGWMFGPFGYFNYKCQYGARMAGITEFGIAAARCSDANMLDRVCKMLISNNFIVNQTSTCCNKFIPAIANAICITGCLKLAPIVISAYANCLPDDGGAKPLTEFVKDMGELAVFYGHGTAARLVAEWISVEHSYLVPHATHAVAEASVRYELLRHVAQRIPSINMPRK